MRYDVGVRKILKGIDLMTIDISCSFFMEFIFDEPVESERNDVFRSNIKKAITNLPLFSSNRQAMSPSH